MTIAEKLFIRVIDEDDTKTLASVDTEWLEGIEITQYEFITKYFRDFSKLPTLKLFSSKFSIKKTSIKDTAGYYLQELKKRFIYVTLMDEVPKYIKSAKSDAENSLEQITSIIAKLASTGKASELFDYGSDSHERYDKYEDRIASGGVTHLETGDDFLTAFMYGYSATDLITIGGRPGTKKTWLMIYLSLALDKVLKKMDISNPLKNRPILFVSNEIGVSEMQDRFDCMKYKLNYGAFLGGDLDKASYKRYKRGLKVRKSSNIKIATKCKRMSDFELLVKIYNPCMVFLDGSYLLEPQMPMSWEKISFITQNLKAINLSAEVPIMNTTQAARRKNSGVAKDSYSAQDALSFGDSYSQDSDVALVIYPDTDSIWNDRMTIQTAKGRSIDLTKGRFQVDAPLNTMKFKFLEYDSEEEEEDETEIVSY